MPMIMYDNDTRNSEDKLKGIVPQHYTAYRVFKIFRFLALFMIALTLLVFCSRFIKHPMLKDFSNSIFFIYVLLGLGGFALMFLLLMFFTYIIWLRKPPFDEWVFEFAEKRLGTDVIYYNSKCLYIQYDRAGTKEVDKKDFVTEMSDTSEHYSYYYVNTFVDLGVIQVECEKRSPIPEKASFSPDDDPVWNIIPVGLTVNNAKKQISPIGWWINDQNKPDNIIETAPSVSFLIAGGTGSGKSVLEQGIVGHVSRYPDKFQLVGIDCKRVEFNLLRGVKGVKAVALDVKSAADAATQMQQLMMNRFKFMEQMQVNNVYKIKNKLVDYYELWGQSYQFDEIFEVWVDIEEDYFENTKSYNAALAQYPDGRMPRIMTIEMLYKALENDELSNPQLNEVKGHEGYITLKDFKKTSNIFDPKILLFLADELNELMNSEDYKSTDAVKQALGSIARLGRAAGCHLALAMQRASSGTVNADLMNNIQQAILLGAFDGGTSSTLFEKDISNLAKPKIKGRAFMQIGKKDIYEVQTYFTQPSKDWVFDEERRDTYVNPEYQVQKFGKVLEQDEIDELLIKNGFKTDLQKEQAKFEDTNNEEEIEEQETEDNKENKDSSEELFDGFDDDFDKDTRTEEDKQTSESKESKDETDTIEDTSDETIKDINGTFKYNEEIAENTQINTFIDASQNEFVEQTFIDEE